MLIFSFCTFDFFSKVLLLFYSFALLLFFASNIVIHSKTSMFFTPFTCYNHSHKICFSLCWSPTKSKNFLFYVKWQFVFDWIFFFLSLAIISHFDRLTMREKWWKSALWIHKHLLVGYHFKFRSFCVCVFCVSNQIIILKMKWENSHM